MDIRAANITNRCDRPVWGLANFVGKLLKCPTVSLSTPLIHPHSFPQCACPAVFAFLPWYRGRKAGWRRGGGQRGVAQNVSTGSMGVCHRRKERGEKGRRGGSRCGGKETQHD